MDRRARCPRSLVLAAFLIVALSPIAARAELPPLVPRVVFFDNPQKTSPLISPDGTRIAYLAPSGKNVLNVWVKTIGKNDDRMVTQDTLRGIRMHFWARDGKHLLFLQDVGGNENFHVYSADLASHATKNQTATTAAPMSPLIAPRASTG